MDRESFLWDGTRKIEDKPWSMELGRWNRKMNMKDGTGRYMMEHERWKRNMDGTERWNRSMGVSPNIFIDRATKKVLKSLN